jgi:hypothetical protein
MRREFLKSPHHAMLAVATLGLGFATGEPLYLILGAATYVLGWVYIPDLPFFRHWVEAKQKEQLDAAAAGEVASFKAKRDQALAALTNSRRQRYAVLADVCRQIEQAINTPDDPRVRRIEELMWTFLRLLNMEQSLDRFLEFESREDVPRMLATAKDEHARLEAEIAQLRAAGQTTALDHKERLLESRGDLLDTLKKRAERIEQARTNLELVAAEEERLDQQIKLLRADAMATASPAAVSARMDATIEQLEATNAWLREMEQFRSRIAEDGLPQQRVGFGETVPPPIPTPTASRTKERA